MNTSKTLVAAFSALICACGGSDSPLSPSPNLPSDVSISEATKGGATFTGSAIAVIATRDAATNTFCETGPVPKAGGAIHNNMANAAISGFISGNGLYCHAGGKNLQGYAESGLLNLKITVGGNTIVASSVHAMAGSECPAGANPLSRGHSKIVGLKINGRAITVTAALNQKVNLPNGYVLINEQTHFVTSFHAGRTVIAIHVVTNGAAPGSEKNVVSDIVIGRSQTHIDCP